ncbi:MAG: UDP-N-acetylmuramoyl-tripeptide--D-alanyl-D-alanine ligase [Candidatus Pacebacteria bacterium]|nr:UDP-N-acetylmuramoyl-tripeptide--D-alanyl-D-alanine ligase [Candidatus Paceibacterota bacterium]MBP9715650.1 UDP-N-acetylmuramoyl-tripeptide--D-alanyl-D-alanine ligase [Candidatus Paceibacterota bacterium]
MKTLKPTFKKIIVNILFWQSKKILKKYNPKIVAITGSVGKTSTKDAIFLVLSHFKSVRKSDKSFNSEIGLPLTIIGVPNAWSNPIAWIENILKGFALIIFKYDYPEWLVLEVGAGKPGDITSVASWLAPDIVVLTHFPEKPVHVEFFGTTERIIEEKSSLAFGLKKDGLLILNHDDEKVYALHKKVKNRVVSYGSNVLATYSESNEVLASNKSHVIPYGVTFKLRYNGNVFPVNMPHVIGMHYVEAALAAIACGQEAGCDILQSISQLVEYRTPPGRMSLIEGMNQSFIIDDTYNSSPMAVFAALRFLADTKGNRTILVLGDMLELGKLAEESHREVGYEAAKIADMIVTVGPRSKFIAEGALEKGFPIKEIYSFESSVTCGKFLAGVIENGDVVLIKGSQSVRLERAVEAIMADPSTANKILCRQEREWKNR